MALAANIGLLIIVGICAGFLAGFAGVGGGIILVPALVYIFGFSQHEAQGTTLALMLPPIGFLAAWQYYKAGNVDIRIALVIIAGFVIGSYFGGKVAVNIPNALLKKIFAILMLIVAIKILFFDGE